MSLFPAKALAEIHKEHKATLQQLGKVEENLSARFYGMEVHIRALVLAALSGEALLLVGPPGTAKSRLIRDFCKLLGLLDKDDRSVPIRNGASSLTHGYFEYLLTRFTEPSELFGFYDITKAREGALERLDKGMMQHAKVVFLDEVFNASSAILNSLLAFMNERLFHDQGERRRVDLEILFAATNDLPQSAELKAFRDRFLLRSWVENVPVGIESVGGLVTRGWSETYSNKPAVGGFDGLLSGLQALRDEIAERTGNGSLVPSAGKDFYPALVDKIDLARQRGASDMSNRRIVKLIDVMLLHRIYREAIGEARDVKDFAFGAPEFHLIPLYFLDRQEKFADYAFDAPHESMVPR